MRFIEGLRDNFAYEIDGPSGPLRVEIAIGIFLNRLTNYDQMEKEAEQIAQTLETQKDLLRQIISKDKICRTEIYQIAGYEVWANYDDYGQALKISPASF
jgi:hypothetical protein